MKNSPTFENCTFKRCPFNGSSCQSNCMAYVALSFETSQYKCMRMAEFDVSNFSDHVFEVNGWVKNPYAGEVER